jgi:hypothetical protein
MLPSATIFVLRRQREVRNFFKQADGANSGNARHIRVSDFGRHENCNRKKSYSSKGKSDIHAGISISAPTNSML